MKKEIRAKIKNIVEAARKRNELLNELGQLDAYRRKIEGVRNKYKNKLP